MTYLICDECNKYYEIQPGEKPEDFILTCECGGSLHPATSKDRIYKTVVNGYNLDEDELFLKKQYRKGYFKVVINVGITIFLILVTLFWIFIFFPIGILCILILLAWLLGKKKILKA